MNRCRCKEEGERWLCHLCHEHVCAFCYFGTHEEDAHGAERVKTVPGN